MKDLSESRILIVDDAKTNIDILVHALRDEYKLSVAVDGAAGAVVGAVVGGAGINPDAWRSAS